MTLLACQKIVGHRGSLHLTTYQLQVLLCTIECEHFESPYTHCLETELFLSHTHSVCYRLCLMAIQRNVQKFL